jgi:hypothetical protein
MKKAPRLPGPSPKQCLVFGQDLSGDVVYHVLKGDW